MTVRDFFQREIREMDAIRGFPWGDAEAYAQLLAQTSYYVGHTTRLLAVSASRMGIAREKLHHRFLRHAAEERSHHLLAQNDLAALGFALDQLPLLPTTAALYESQYYRVEHIAPTMIFGYILALEGLSVVHGPFIHQAARGAHGERACSFLKLHSEEDPDHLDKAFEAISELSELEHRLIEENFRFTCALYRSLLAECAQARVTTIAA